MCVYSIVLLCVYYCYSSHCYCVYLLSALQQASQERSLPPVSHCSLLISFLCTAPLSGLWQLPPPPPLPLLLPHTPTTTTTYHHTHHTTTTTTPTKNLAFALCLLNFAYIRLSSFIILYSLPFHSYYSLSLNSIPGLFQDYSLAIPLWISILSSCIGGGLPS